MSDVLGGADVTSTPKGEFPSLSIVLPVYNAVDWAPRTIERVDVALSSTPWEGAQIVAVDDGSTDGTGEALDRIAEARRDVLVVHTENRGRLLARKAGIDAATADIVLLIDCRVFLDEGALRHVAQVLEVDPGKQVWNGHVVIDTSENPFARFWEAVTFVAWRRYLGNPRPIEFGGEDFDYYPKGTGCFMAPRQLLLESYEAFSSLFEDSKLVNDDTSLLRHLADQRPIRLDPGFSCVYHARGSLRTFLQHGFFRGIHFVDGYLDPKTRYFKPLVAFLVLTPAGIALVVKAPAAGALAGTVGLIVTFLTLLALRVGPKTAFWFTLLAPVFAVVYGGGIWRGVWLILKAKARRR